MSLFNVSGDSTLSWWLCRRCFVPLNPSPAPVAHDNPGSQQLPNAQSSFQANAVSQERGAFPASNTRPDREEPWSSGARHWGKGKVCTPLPRNHCGKPLPSSFGKGRLFFQSVLCSPTPIPAPCVGCRAVCLLPSSWQGASQPKHTQISRRGLDPSAVFALLPAAGQAATLLLAPCPQLRDVPAVATSPIQAPGVVLLRASWCSCCFPAGGRGQESINYSSCLPGCPGHTQAQPGWVSTLPGLYSLTAAGTRGNQLIKENFNPSCLV